MARTKKTSRSLAKQVRRTTLTKFRLSRYVSWPKWTTDATADDGDDELSAKRRDVHNMTLKDYYHGPLADVEGVIKVRLGRSVGDVADAAFIVLWESAEHVKAFQESPALFEPFLRGLGLLPKDGGSAPSPFTAVVQYDWGFSTGDFDDEPDGIEGRITLTVMDIPYAKADRQDRAGWRETLSAGPGSLSSMDEYEEPEGSFRYPTRYSWSEAYTYLSMDDEANAAGTEAEAKEGNEISVAVCYLFHRWNAAPEMREKEAALFKDPEKIAEAVSKAMPPVKSWRIERWDIEVAPCCLELCGTLDEAEIGPPEEDPETAPSVICIIKAR
ncbi:hypothetical protein V8F06_013496 [Rhypophila decipiens]